MKVKVTLRAPREVEVENEVVSMVAMIKKGG